MTLTKIILTIVTGSVLCFGQAFTSGSTGSDGALNLITPGTIDFDPAALGLNPAGDNIFNFTTINIGPGVIVKMRASKLREEPVVFLATGAVTIAGTLDLSGADGYPAGTAVSLRVPAEPGPGGYPGGVSARLGSPAQPGGGPGGSLGCGNHATLSAGGCLSSNVIYDNSLLVPLRGGSGGGGDGDVNRAGSAGGAGGGAIRIISNTSINLSGSLLASGGNGRVPCCGGAGSGGAVHLQAPSVSVSGILKVNGGDSSVFQGGDGWLRIDSTSRVLSGTISPAPNLGPLFNVPLPTAVPTVRITSINGVAVSASPTGNFATPDATINSPVAVPVAFTATNIPLGTVVKLIVSSETGVDQTVSASPLAGTVISSTGTASVLWPLGVSRVFIRAIW